MGAFSAGGELAPEAEADVKPAGNMGGTWDEPTCFLGTWEPGKLGEPGEPGDSPRVSLRTPASHGDRRDGLACGEPGGTAHVFPLGTPASMGTLWGPKKGTAWPEPLAIYNSSFIMQILDDSNAGQIHQLVCFQHVAQSPEPQNWRIGQTVPTGSGKRKAHQLPAPRKARSQTFHIFFYSHSFIALQPIPTFRPPRRRHAGALS